MPSERMTVAFIVVVACLVLATMLEMADREDRKWERFKAEHRCLPIAVDPDRPRVGWVCNDGKTYFR